MLLSCGPFGFRLDLAGQETDCLEPQRDLSRGELRALGREHFEVQPAALRALELKDVEAAQRFQTRRVPALGAGWRGGNPSAIL